MFKIHQNIKHQPYKAHHILQLRAIYDRVTEYQRWVFKSHSVMQPLATALTDSGGIDVSVWPSERWKKPAHFCCKQFTPLFLKKNKSKIVRQPCEKIWVIKVYSTTIKSFQSEHASFLHTTVFIDCTLFTKCQLYLTDAINITRLP